MGTRSRGHYRAGLLAGCAVLLILVAQPIAALTSSQKCEHGVASALRKCVKKVRRTVGDCYAASAAPCAPSAPDVTAALAKLQQKVLVKCPDALTVQATGYGSAMTPPTLVARLQEACTGEPAALAARSFGGPHGAALAAADAAQRTCLLDAYGAGGRLIDRALKALSACVLRAHKGATCDTAKTTGKVAGAAADAVAAITGACSAGLATLVAVQPATFVDRTTAQVECLAATGLADSGPLAFACGPRTGVPVPARAVDTLVVLNEAEWGTRCGNGSAYAFRIRLAPAGQPVEKVIFHMQGGGACLSDADCAATAPSLFTATDDAMPTGGYMSSSAVNNPVFASWTKVFLPYCTQDLHIGGGLVGNFPSITVNRFGALNARAALRYVRDVLWAEMNASEPEGYRPDRLRVLFGGTSAGGYGVSYNYHYVLDDLRWARSTAVPDAGLALDNGGAGVAVLGVIASSTTQPAGWGALPMLPPYCFANPCYVGPTMKAAHAARLLAVPEQQMLTVSNQVDNVQVNTTNFPNLTSWINALRSTYCASQGVPGLHSFFSANTASIHGTLANAQFTSLTAAGVVLRDWLGGAASSPLAVTDAVSEGTLAAMFGANPFSCPVSP